MQRKGKYASELEDPEEKKRILEERRLKAGYFRNHEKKELI